MTSTKEERRNRTIRLREAILELYGRQCYNCAYKKDVRALTLDHINGNPSRFKCRSGHTLYAAILNGSVPEHEFQILCANCNQIKRLITPSERSTPHETNLRPDTISDEMNLNMRYDYETVLNAY